MKYFQYNGCMPKIKFDNYLYDVEPDIDLSQFNRQQINKLMLDIDEDITFLEKCLAPPRILKGHHELLSRLVKNYGH